MLKILYVLASLDSGGVGKLICDYVVRFSDNILCDFAVSDSCIGIYESLLEKKGCQIYHIPKMRDSLLKHNKELLRIIRQGKYDVVHDNCDYRSYWTMKISKKCGCPVRIVHIHSAFLAKRRFLTLLARILMNNSIRMCSDVFACGEKALKITAGNINDKKHRIHIIPNAIDLNKYAFSEKKRIALRKALNLRDDELVIGSVSRFTYAKNHLFIIDLFSNLLAKSLNVKLILVGDGELYDNVFSYAKSKGVLDNILFLGKRDDVHDLLNAFDVFLLPSLFEGLPVSLVEAQANGLPAIISKNVTNEISFSNMVIQLPIDNGTNDWVDVLLSKKLKRYDVPRELYHYDIDAASSNLEKLYFKLVSINGNK